MMNFTESKTFRAMGTVNTITIYQENEEECLEKAVRKVKKLHDRMSVYEAGSEISRVNAHGFTRAYYGRLHRNRYETRRI